MGILGWVFSSIFVVQLFISSANAGQDCAQSLRSPDWASDSSDSVGHDRWLHHQKNFRTLTEYSESLPSGFERAVKSILNSSLWIDFGAGRALAMRDLVFIRQALRMPIPKLLAVDYATTPDLRTGEIRHIPRKVESLMAGELDQARLATDFFGPASYTRDLGRVLQIELSHLELGGELYVRIGYDTYFLDSEGRPISLSTYLNKFEGVQLIQVEDQMRSANLLRGYTPKKAFAFRRTHETLGVPKAQFLEHEYESGLPPRRVFRLAE